MSDRFTAAKLEILDAILTTRGVRPTSARIGAVMLLRYASRKAFLERGTIEAYPSQATVAKLACATVEAVRRAALDLRPFMTATPRAGFRAGTIYTFRLPGKDPAPEPADMQRFCGESAATTPNKITASPPTKSRPRSQQNHSMNPLKEPIEEPIEGGTLFAAPTAPRRRERKRPGRPLPEGFPDDAALLRMQERFAAEGLSVDVQTEAERFRAHHEGKGTLSANWPASWTTWTLNGLRWAREAPPKVNGRQRPGWSALDYAETRIRQDQEDR